MTTFIHHLCNEAWFAFHLKRRYLLHTIMGYLMLIFIFAGLIRADLAASQKSLDTGAADSLIIGFMVWLFAALAYSCTSKDVSEFMEARSIEHAFMAPVPFVYILCVRAFIQILFSIATFIFMVFVMHLILGERSRIEFISLFFACLLAAPSLLGVGLAVSGILLFIKRGEVLLAFTFMGILGLVALPAYPANAWAFLPYSLGAAAARAAGNGEQIAGATFWLISMNSAAYLFLGCVVFSFMQRHVRAKGILGHL